MRIDIAAVGAAEVENVRNRVLSIASGLSQFADLATLKKDGRRISLEGVLTGAAVGVVLLYLLEEVQAATGRRRIGGPVDEPGPDDQGRPQAKAGTIRIRPLDGVDVAFDAHRPQAFRNADAPKAVGSGQSDTPSQAGASTAQGLMASPPPARATVQGSANGGSIPPVPPTPVPPTPEPPPPEPPPEPPPPEPPPPEPPPPEPPPPEPPDPTANLPQMVLVVVRTFGGSSSRSVESSAESIQNATQVGIENSLLDLRAATGPQMGLRSDRNLRSFALSELDDADLILISEHIGLLNATFLNGSAEDVLVFDARDVLNLGLLSSGSANAEVQSRTVAMERSSLKSIGGDNLVATSGITQLTFTGLGNSERAALSFDLLTTALKDSGIRLGRGNDTVTINSGFYISDSDSLTATSQRGLQFDLGELPASNGDDSNWSFSLNARAIGLENSLINVGNGDDRVSILTRIDEDLMQDLGAHYANSQTTIQLERVGLFQSKVRMGAGNDQLRINGSVIDSTINLGSGDNSLFLEGDVLPGSRILMGNGNNSVTFSNGLGGLLRGGNGNDRFTLSNLQLAGEVDGGGGSDSLVAPKGQAGRRELLVLNGVDAGNLDGIRFRNIETVDLGGGNDVALVDLGGSLTGQLLGGDGLDRLEYSNWTLPVSVDLDRGTATGIGGGKAGSLAGFEQVVGGLGNDRLSSSGAFAGIDGSLGDDVLFLRWSPWLSSFDKGLQVKGGPGRDLFVFSGVEQTPMAGWDGVSGLPDLVDLDLLGDQSDSLAWLRRDTLVGGGSQESLLRLTPSGPEGIGDPRLLPIAPLESLLTGMTSDTLQLGIAVDGTGGSRLHLLGVDGIGTSRVIANVSSELLTPGVIPVSESSVLTR